MYLKYDKLRDEARASLHRLNVSYPYAEIERKNSRNDRGEERIRDYSYDEIN